MTTNLPELGDVTRLSDHVVRVLGQNPGKFTLQGTNTYIIGDSNPRILVDTGEGLPSYLPILSSALKETAPATHPSQPDISDIVISHWHGDHVGGLSTVLTLLKELWDQRQPGKPYSPPRLHKFPIAEGHQHRHSHSGRPTLAQIIEDLPKGLYEPGPTGTVWHELKDGQVFKNATGATILFSILHTPGHTVDSIAIHLPTEKALYTADTVLGHGTAVFEDLSDYIQSLKRMLALGSTEEDKEFDYSVLYPAHGAVVSKGRQTIAGYIKHRLDREAEILRVLRSPTLPDEGDLWTTWNIVRVIYKDYPKDLWLPAAHGVDLHLRKLVKDCVVKEEGGEGKDTKWSLISASASPNL